MHKVRAHDVVPVILAALVEHVPHSSVPEHAVNIVNVLVDKVASCSISGHVADDVEDWTLHRRRLARER